MSRPGVRLLDVRDSPSPQIYLQCMEARPKTETPSAVRPDDRHSSRTSGTLTAHDRGFDDRLIDEIQRHPVLYGGGNCPHGGNPKRVECWDALAKMLPLPGKFWSSDACLNLFRKEYILNFNLKTILKFKK